MISTQRDVRERTKKLLWFIQNFEVTQNVGFDCLPENHEYWFCPALRASFCLGTNCFEREADAKRRCATLIAKEIGALMAKAELLAFGSIT